MKLVNENDPGLEFAGASMFPDDEVVFRKQDSYLFHRHVKFNSGGRRQQRFRTLPAPDAAESALQSWCLCRARI